MRFKITLKNIRKKLVKLHTVLKTNVIIGLNNVSTCQTHEKSFRFFYLAIDYNLIWVKQYYGYGYV